MKYTDRYAMVMCHRMENGFVKIWTHDSLQRGIHGEIVRKIDTITEVSTYEVRGHWNTRIITNDDQKMFLLSFDERDKAERLAHELTLLITGGDIINEVIRRNQKILDEEVKDNDKARN